LFFVCHSELWLFPIIKFLPLCPDFVVELLSPTDREAWTESNRLKVIQEKMREYRDNGTRLGWPIDPTSQQVEIYRINKEVEILKSPLTLSGEDVLPDFTLNLEAIW
jgi:Uma2 family endonuclease